jgi:hypothetical protein
VLADLEPVWCLQANTNLLVSIVSNRNKLHNVVNLEYWIVPPEPKPTPATPPELVEPVPVEVPPSLEPQSEPVLQEVRKKSW